MALDKSSLSHLTAAIVGVGATILAAMGVISGDQALYVYFFIGGYAFKNGYHYTKNGNNK